jgi:hypothetical protein
MAMMRQDHMIHGLCLLLGVGAVGVAGWAVLSGQVARLGVDGLFLLAVCLLFAFAFLWSPLSAIRTAMRQRLAQQAEPVAAGKSQGAA